MNAGQHGHPRHTSPGPAWGPDVLGEGFEATTFHLAGDSEGEVVATLVRLEASDAGGRAVLYVHGFNDYFFQADLARWFVDRGWSFYGLDLRKHGRSLRPHQTPNMCTSLDDYDAELDAAVEVIRGAGATSILLGAHSTGGLTVPLWLARRPEVPAVGLLLNSPFLDFKQSAAVQSVVLPATRILGRRSPDRVLPAGVSGLYGRSIHRSYEGEWDFDLEWKPLEAPVRVGWLQAIAAGQRNLRRGLDLGVPALVLASTRTVTTRVWVDEMRCGDAVLDADRIAVRAPSIGRHVTIVRVADALHDVWLSGRPSRDAAYSVTGKWLDAWVA